MVRYGREPPEFSCGTHAAHTYFKPGLDNQRPLRCCQHHTHHLLPLVMPLELRGVAVQHLEAHSQELRIVRF